MDLQRNVTLGNIERSVEPRPIPAVARSKAWGLRPLACWDCGFASRRGHGWMSVVSVCWQVEVKGPNTRPEEF
jgi:hypothetical protein